MGTDLAGSVILKMGRRRIWEIGRGHIYGTRKKGKSWPTVYQMPAEAGGSKGASSRRSPKGDRRSREGGSDGVTGHFWDDFICFLLLDNNSPQGEQVHFLPIS